jgi:hypothetical protein
LAIEVGCAMSRVRASTNLWLLRGILCAGVAALIGREIAEATATVVLVVLLYSLALAFFFVIPCCLLPLSIFVILGNLWVYGMLPGARAD